MTGGILQLVAKGVDDLFIVGDPDITFFKTSYRRHTNFSRGELDINFENRVDFGRTANIKIKRWGDLVHRLFLVINIPEVDLVFVSLTISEVQQILLGFEIVWETERGPDEQFDQAAFDEVTVLIDNKIQELRDRTRILTEIIGFFDPGGELNPSRFPNLTVDEYYDVVIRRLIEFDQFELQYKFLDDHNKDRMPGLDLANSVRLQAILFEEFVKFATGQTTFDPASFNDENLFFLLNTDITNYSIGGSANQTDANTVFRAGIQNAYGTEAFTFIDSFKNRSCDRGGRLG